MTVSSWFPPVCLAALLAVPLWAAEAPANDPAPAANVPGMNAGPGSRMRPDGDSRRGGGERFQSMLNSMKESNPEAFAEIEKLMQTDRRAAMQKIRELMPRSSRSGFSRSDRGGNGPWSQLMQQIKERFPTEYEEIEKLMQTDRTAAIAKLRELATKAGLEIPEGEPGQQFHAAQTESPRNRNRMMTRAADQIIRQLYPEEYEVMLELRKVDPDAAREAFRAMVKEAGLSLEDLEKTAIHAQRRIRAVNFSDKELEAQYEQANSTGASPGGFPGGFPSRGMFRGFR